MINTKNSLILLLSVVLNSFCFSQEGFKTTFFQGVKQSNVSFQCIEVNGKFYFSGDIFDEKLGYWTGFFAESDMQGKLNIIGTEKRDTINVSLSNNIVFDSNGLYIIGHFRENLILHYNFHEDSIYVIKKIDPKKHDMVVSGLVFDKEGDFIMCGYNYFGNNIDQDIKVIKLRDSIIYSFIDTDTSSVSVPNSIPLIAPNGNIYLPCFDISKDNQVNDRAYILCLDSNLNKIFSTKNTLNEISLRHSKGSLLDKEGNIVISGYDKRPMNNKIELVPQVAKLDPNGKPLWKVDAGKPNVNNFYGWGSWQKIIESQEGDGYILAGSHFIGSALGDQELGDAALTKISTDGETLWSKSYSFRDGTNRVFCLFNDIIATSDGGYFAVGESLNASVPTSQLPDPPGFQSIILKTDANGNFMIDTTSTIDVTYKNLKLGLKLYPNPAADQVIISQTGDTKLNIRIFNSHGRLMDAFDCMDKDHNILINTSTWAAGIYLASFWENGDDGDELGCKQFFIFR